MKILVLTNMYPNPQVKWAGTFVKQQVESLRELEGVEVDVLAVSGAMTGGHFYHYLLGYGRLLKKLYWNKQRYDVVHSHHYFMTLLYKLTFCSLPLVYTMHENNYFVTRPWVRKVMTWCAKHTAATLVVWHKMLKLLAPDKTHFVPCGVNRKLFRPLEMREARQTLGLCADKNYLFFPAPKSRPEKNSAFLESFINNHADFLAEHQLEVIWGGNIAYEQMPLYMNAANILLSFSDYESDGMTYKEAMACNLPVITFEAGNSSLYFDDQTAGHIIPREITALKQAILAWLGRRSNGSKKLQDLNMDLDGTSQKLLSIYRQLVSSAGS